MIKLYLKQSWEVMKQNRFFSFISILSTAVTIAFVMVAFMAYDISSSDLPPEVNRSRSIYSAGEYSYRTADRSNANGGMSYKTAEFITQDIPSAEVVSIHMLNRPFTCEALGGEGFKGRKRGRFVDMNWWKIFRYDFIAGNPFIEEDEAAGRNVVIVTESLARQLFQSTDVIGREMLISYYPYIITGVVKDVSSQFSIAYADFWANYMSQPNIKEEGYGSESVAGQTRFIVLAQKGKLKQATAEIENAVKKYNDYLPLTTFELEPENHVEYTFSNFFDINMIVVYVLLVCIFLVIPAVNISGLISSMLDKRYEEIGVRKVYGASGRKIIIQFLSENFLLILIGGIIGIGLSFMSLYLFRTWLLGVSVAYSSSLNLSWWMFFRPSIFLMAFFGCLIFNVLSTLIPVWYASKKNIADVLKS